MSVSLLVAMLALGGAVADDVTSKFVSEGVTQRVGGYRPIRVELKEEGENVKTPPADLATPLFGKIEIADKSYGVIISQGEGEDPKQAIYIDSNADGDYTNDPQAEWNANKRGELTQHAGTATIELGPDQQGRINFYRFDPNDPNRAQLKNTLLYYTDFGYEYSFQLDGKEFSTFVSGKPSSEGSMPIDRDGNGQISYNFEVVQLGKPFNFTGSTYILSVKDGEMNLAKSDEQVEQTPLPPDLNVGKDALAFTATMMNGETVNFPKDYAGKVVMLDFWATWCGPCVGEVPHMKQAYSDWHDKGFEILGVSFDFEGEEHLTKVKEFLEAKEITWNQIYEGKGWETTLGQQHDVSGIPFVLLVDGDTGKIIAKDNDLRGEGLTKLIGEVLEKKKSGE